MQDFGAVTVEEHRHGGTLWVAVRARGAEWSWLTPDDALRLAQHWMVAYGASTPRHGLVDGMREIANPAYPED